MAGKKFSLLKNFTTFNNDIKTKSETTVSKDSTSYSDNLSKNIEFQEDNKYSFCPFLEDDLITTVAINFPEPYKDIINSLVNLKDTIEKSIDYIEDASSFVIKKERNFDLSTQYRELSMSLYVVSNNIEDYIGWMKDLSGKKEKTFVEESPVINDYETIEDESKKNIKKTELNVCNDFTDRKPLSFKIDNYERKVDDWNDLVIKTADTLIKTYKNSKYSLNTNIRFPEINSKKSEENDFRDTVIEMLIEYKIHPNRYFINIK